MSSTGSPFVPASLVQVLMAPGLEEPGVQGGKTRHTKPMPTKPLSALDLDEVLLHARASFEHLRGARLFLTGGTGFFGHWLLESLLRADLVFNLNVRATVLTRNIEAFRHRSPHLFEGKVLHFL